MDSKGNFEWINDGFTRIYGYSLEQLIEEEKHNIIGTHSKLSAKDIADLWYGDKKTMVYESENNTFSGAKIWTQTTLTPILDKKKNVKKLVAIETDITKLKEAENQIQKQRDQLAKANETKDTFFSIIAHDLRSPFSSFFSLTNLMVENFKDFSEEEIVTYLGEIRNSSQKTFNLIENLLDWARTQQGEIKFQPKNTNISSLVLENIELMQNIAKQKGITLVSNINEEIMIHIDENMIKTVFRNLISNAIKFTMENGKVDVNARKEKEHWQFTIRDNGVGISAKNISKLFKIDSHHTSLGTKSEKGTGLGLILCKEFVEKNGGKIWVESEKNEGSTFYFTLPQAPKA